MMNCPVCCGKSTVIDTRSPDDVMIVRKRKCQDCGYIWHTKEEDLFDKELEQLKKEFRYDELYRRTKKDSPRESK